MISTGLDATLSPSRFSMYAMVPRWHRAPSPAQIKNLLSGVHRSKALDQKMFTGISACRRTWLIFASPWALLARCTP